MAERYKKRMFVVFQLVTKYHLGFLVLTGSTLTFPVCLALLVLLARFRITII